MWCYIKKRIDILKPKLLVTHPHSEEFTTQPFEFQAAKIRFYLDLQYLGVLTRFSLYLFKSVIAKAKRLWQSDHF
ncbi:hypothetical protein A9Q87_04820 [Flavobacteriales bacterium 34_180_T64]|nr:hypothetical protein A9Q87_04820 [Flavobacteriales bacterium 34_180_T64]